MRAGSTNIADAEKPYRSPVRIFLLRRAFSEDSSSGYIATVPRRGYRFTAGVRTIGLEP
jgi:DNA-binding winged helix-turn-helix (wHTH) protein